MDLCDHRTPSVNLDISTRSCHYTNLVCLESDHLCSHGHGSQSLYGSLEALCDALDLPGDRSDGHSGGPVVVLICRGLCSDQEHLRSFVARFVKAIGGYRGSIDGVTPAVIYRNWLAGVA